MASSEQILHAKTTEDAKIRGKTRSQEIHDAVLCVHTDMEHMTLVTSK